MSDTPCGARLWRLADAVTGIVRSAGARVMEIYAGDFRVRRKRDETLVTSADLAAHDIIGESLALLEPGLPIISEESPIPPFEQRSGWRSYWLVDPLDGTRGFAARTGEFTVNVALVCGDRPVLGVVGVPVAGSCYAAVRGGGARLVHADGVRQSIATRRLPADQVVVLRSRTRRHEKVDALVARLGKARIIVAGSALKSCLVARGVADLYPAFGPTSEWDTAAGQCLVEEAGGGLADLALEPLRYNARDSLENPSFIAFGDPRADWRGLLAEAHS